MDGARRAFTVAASIILAGSLLTACASAQEPPPPAETESSGIEGRSLVFGAGGGGFADTAAASEERPYEGVIEIREGDRSGAVVVTVAPDASGDFKVDLPPGTYTLIQLSADGAGIGEPVTVTVGPGSYEDVKLSFAPL